MPDHSFLTFQHSQFAGTLGMLRYRESVDQVLAASIIIVSYNGWQDLERCLASLENAGTFASKDYEVIVVDNCSTDDSPQQVEWNFPSVRLVRSSRNLGFGEGNNLGAQLARGEVLVFLNPDTTVAPDWLKPLLQALESDATAGMATSRILMMNDPERVNTCGNDLHLSGLSLCRGLGETGSNSKPDGFVQVAAISGAAFAIRRELFERIGGFDETFFLYMEDTDLSVRVQIAGYCCVYVPDSVVYHDYELNFGPMKTYYQERNRYLMLFKSMRWATLFVLLPALLLAEAVTWGFILLRDRARFKNKLFAYVWVIYWWREILEKRRQTQRLRRVPDRVLLLRMTSTLDFAQVGSGWVANVSHMVFDPLFYLVRTLSLAIVWW